MYCWCMCACVPAKRSLECRTRRLSFTSPSTSAAFHAIRSSSSETEAISSWHLAGDRISRGQSTERSTAQHCNAHTPFESETRLGAESGVDTKHKSQHNRGFPVDRGKCTSNVQQPTLAGWDRLRVRGPKWNLDPT
ncbi:uncharacterized protein UTRI_05411 [Ustilago trichophora]|uniref:Uncharacterized protein n=1 Tax=Ustilago trichophora TaxID=86804 RepID=A0A5C3EK09_9BASI|nr:uncharacterized protein UTRI_05411 [Ustilago trichophora]